MIRHTRECCTETTLKELEIILMKTQQKISS